MRLLASSPSLLRRAAVLVGVAAVGFATIAPAQAVNSSEVAKKATINTFGSWDGTTMVQPFGCPDTTTYGEVITIPNGKNMVKKFTFTWLNMVATGSMVVRGEVYAWDGSEATGNAVAESKPKTVDFNDGVFHNVSFKVKKAKVTPGSQYVIFASIDKDYEQCTDNYEVGWGAISDDSVYPGGTFVYQNNGGDESQWTTAPWTSFGWDLAFKAYLGK